MARRPVVIGLGLLLGAGAVAACASGDGAQLVSSGVVEDVGYVEAVTGRADGRSLDIHRPGALGHDARVVEIARAKHDGIADGPVRRAILDAVLAAVGVG